MRKREVASLTPGFFERTPDFRRILRPLSLSEIEDIEKPFSYGVFPATRTRDDGVLFSLPPAWNSFDFNEFPALFELVKAFRLELETRFFVFNFKGLPSLVVERTDSEEELNSMGVAGS
jgi:hypothetical protein